MARQSKMDTELSKYYINIQNSHINTLVVGDGNIVNNVCHTSRNAEISTPPKTARRMTAIQDGGEFQKRRGTKQKQSKIRFPQRKFRPEAKAVVKLEREEDVDVSIIPQVFPNISVHGDRENARSLNKFFVVLNKLHPARDSGNWRHFYKVAESLLTANDGDPLIKILITLEKSVVQSYQNNIEEAEGMVLEELQTLEESKVKATDVTGYHFLVAMAHCHLTGFYRRLNKHGKAEKTIGIGDQNSNTPYLKALMYYEMASNWTKYISSIPNGPARDELVARAKDLMKHCITLCTELDNDASVYIRKHHFGLIKLALMSLNCRTRVAREQIPTQRCIDDAKNCLKTVEERYEADIREAPGQRIQLFVAKSDLAFRQKNYQVAQEYCVNALAVAEESGFLLEIKGIKDRLEDISTLMGKERRRDPLEIHSPEERHADSLSSSTSSSKKNSPCSSGCEMEIV
ncbi:uncharacterized protein [Montipora foliosa]|uniref:uncharacterized protein n=1 Tax=Montipora foliosa TaxID=591990 RepID=UPI0035F19873